MAERRMFAKSIIDSDAFLELPAKSQLLYFHLAMRADDEGFISNPKSILRLTGCTEADMQKLVEGKYLIPFGRGILAIRHWKVHNYIRADRLKPTVYEAEKAMLLVEESGVYTLCQSSDGQVVAQDRLGKDRLGKVSSGQESIGGCGGAEADPAFRAPTLTEVMIYVKQKKYQVDPEAFLGFYHRNGWRVNGKPMKDWKGAVDLWQARKW